MDPATSDKDGQLTEPADEIERTTKNRIKIVKGYAKKLPVIIDRLAIMFYIGLEIIFYHVFIPK